MWVHGSGKSIAPLSLCGPGVPSCAGFVKGDILEFLTTPYVAYDVLIPARLRCKGEILPAGSKLLKLRSGNGLWHIDSSFKARRRFGERAVSQALVQKEGTSPPKCQLFFFQFQSQQRSFLLGPRGEPPPPTYHLAVCFFCISAMLGGPASAGIPDVRRGGTGARTCERLHLRFAACPRKASSGHGVCHVAPCQGTRAKERQRKASSAKAYFGNSPESSTTRHQTCWQSSSKLGEVAMGPPCELDQCSLNRSHDPLPTQ